MWGGSPAFRCVCFVCESVCECGEGSQLLCVYVVCVCESVCECGEDSQLLDAVSVCVRVCVNAGRNTSLKMRTVRV